MDIGEVMKYFIQDIDILINNIINMQKLTTTGIVAVRQPLILKIDSLLNDYKKLEERIKELEEHQKKFYNGELYTAKQLKQIEENQKKYFINKQRVKELKESILLGPTIVGGRRNAKTLEYGIKLGKIKACEELLEEKQ